MQEAEHDYMLKLITREEAARLLSVPVSIVVSLQEAGELRCRKLGTRVWTTRQALADYINDGDKDTYRRVPAQRKRSAS